MIVKEYKIQFLILAGCISGVVWLILTSSGSFDHSVCMIRNITGYPCPSCGSTRSIHALIHLDIIGSILINPLGPLLFLSFMILLPWSLYDLIAKKKTLSYYYDLLENRLKNRSLIVILVTLVIINWIWNIIKNL